MPKTRTSKPLSRGSGNQSHVLVLAPHPDDESLGCGGAICLHTTRHDRVTVLFLTSGELGLKHLSREQAWKIREMEACRAGRILGLHAMEFLRFPDWTLNEHVEEVARKVAVQLRSTRPGIIYCPHPQEWHPDHKAAVDILRAALKLANYSCPVIRAYEVWTPLGAFDQVEDISSVFQQKLKAVRAHRSQLKEFDYARAIKGLNEYRGVMAGRCPYAEVFQLLRF